MKGTAFILRPMEPGDIAGAMRLSRAEGWNQAEKDWKLLIENPQNTCVLVEFDKKIIGTTTAINYSNQVAWVGMVLVDREYRGQGISKSLLVDIFKKIESKSIKLDATPEGQKVYKKFDFTDEYLITRMTIPSMNSLPSWEEDNDVFRGDTHLNDTREIISYDHLIFGADRTVLIEFLVREYPEKVWLLRRNNSIAGFALGRGGRKYHQIGPVFASNNADAKNLVAKALKELINQPVVVDVLSDKEDLIAWLSSIGFTRQRCFIRMYKKTNPFPGITANQYLICGPEFG